MRIIRQNRVVAPQDRLWFQAKFFCDTKDRVAFNDGVLDDLLPRTGWDVGVTVRFTGYAVVNRGRGYRLIVVGYPDETAAAVAASLAFR